MNTYPTQTVPQQPVAGSQAPWQPAATTSWLSLTEQPATQQRPLQIPPAVSAPLSTALLGAVIGGASDLGRNLHRVQRGEMTIKRALVRSLMHGAAGSIATTTAAALTSSITESDAVHLAALAVATASMSYLITAAARATHGLPAEDAPA